MTEIWKCDSCDTRFEHVHELVKHVCSEREVPVRASTIAQAAFALGKATSVFAERMRVQQVTTFECAYCWAYVLRPEWSGRVAEEIEHKPECLAMRALNEIEKAMKLLAEVAK